jgi:hypothetical protein
MPESAPTAPPSAPVSGPAFLVRALRHRNYRLFFSGQSVSLVGTWMEVPAIPPITAGIQSATELAVPPER